MTEKTYGFITVALIAIFALVFTGCEQPSDSDESTSGDITYTVAQTGGANGQTNSTGIIFTFSASVDSLGLTAADITVSGAATKGTAALTGTGKTRTLAITVSAAGNATVKITKTGIEAETKNVSVFKAGQTGPASGAHIHDWGDWDGTTIPGTEMRTCKENGSHIQTRLTGTDRFTFEAVNISSYRVRKGTVTTGEVIIPAYYRPSASGSFVPVTEIGSVSDELLNGAFLSSIGITSVTIPETVTTIGNMAFATCNLTSITIPASVTTIGEAPFFSCGSLASINIDNGNPNYTSEGGILYNKAKTTLIQAPGAISGNVNIPNSVTTIGNYAFGACSLTGITIPNSVTSIGNMAFIACSLTSITIPASVTTIGEAPFPSCDNLASINVNSGNPNYASEGGILYNKIKTTLIQAPGGISGSVTIPNSVTSIGRGAFLDCNGLTSITIPNSVTSIGTGAFSECGGLTSITIPNSVTSIGATAFHLCKKLTSITIPASVMSIGNYAFEGTDLTSVTFAVGSNITDANFGEGAFPRDGGRGDDNLKTAYLAAGGGAGTYTRTSIYAAAWTKVN